MSVLLKVLLGVAGVAVLAGVLTGIVAASGAEDPVPRETIVIDDGRSPNDEQPDKQPDKARNPDAESDDEDDRDDRDDRDIDSVHVEPDDLDDARDDQEELREEQRERDEDRRERDREGEGDGD